MDTYTIHPVPAESCCTQVGSKPPSGSLAREERAAGFPSQSMICPAPYMQIEVRSGPVQVRSTQRSCVNVLRCLSTGCEHWQRVERRAAIGLHSSSVLWYDHIYSLHSSKSTVHPCINGCRTSCSLLPSSPLLLILLHLAAKCRDRSLGPNTLHSLRIASPPDSRSLLYLRCPT